MTGPRTGKCKAGGAAARRQPKKADVLVVVRRETWLQIARGRLALRGALRRTAASGGNLEAAKRLTQHLSDPTVPFVPPAERRTPMAVTVGRITNIKLGSFLTGTVNS
jgi:hypothetical protein